MQVELDVLLLWSFAVSFTSVLAVIICAVTLERKYSRWITGLVYSVTFIIVYIFTFLAYSIDITNDLLGLLLPLLFFCLVCIILHTGNWSSKCYIVIMAFLASHVISFVLCGTTVSFLSDAPNPYNLHTISLYIGTKVFWFTAFFLLYYFVFRDRFRAAIEITGGSMVAYIPISIISFFSFWTINVITGYLGIIPSTILLQSNLMGYPLAGTTEVRFLFVAIYVAISLIIVFEYQQMLSSIFKLSKLFSQEMELTIALKIAEENKKANIAKSKFLATMSHEIRTPMNVVLGIAESTLGDPSLNKPVREGLEMIHNAGDMLLHIINDLLDLSKIEAGKLELIFVEYELANLINDVTHLKIGQFEHKQVEFLVHIDENLPSRLYGDELRIKQILNNILSNAFKYTNEGEVCLSISIDPTDDKKETLVFTIRDTGQGMTEEQISKLFDEYSRFNQEVNRETMGTGLGMTITQHLLKMMGGEMTVESSPGTGSTFTIHLPVEKRGDQVLGSDMAASLQDLRLSNRIHNRNIHFTREPMPYGRVLVVDDMDSNLYVMDVLMKPYELEIEKVSNGFDAIKLIQDGYDYDIVFMDHMMPKMDGIETTQKIRELGYTKPIVALTANAIAGQDQIFLRSGFDAYISKPIDVKQLDHILTVFVKEKQYG